MPEVPSDVWVHPAAAVRPSPIAGRGLFIDADVVAGTPLVRFGGRTVSTARLHRLFAAATAHGTYVDTIAVDDDTHLVLPTGTLAHYANHSCDPTMWLGGPRELVARRDLAVGTELTSDYGVISDDPSFRMDCHCGTPACRRVVTGSDWRRPELRALHAGRWPPGLQRRIAAGA